MATITYNVTGMSCQHCVNAITEEVTKVDDVDTVVVDLDNGTVTVTGAELDDASLKAAIDEAGYEVVGT